MPKRGENIHKRKDGRWEGRLKIGKYNNGATKYKSVYAKTYTEAKQKLEELRSFCSNNQQDKLTNTSCLFAEVVQKWFESVRFTLKGSTVYKYEYLIGRHILPVLGSRKIGDISANTVNLFLDQKLRNGKLDGSGALSASYVKVMRHIICSTMTYAAEEGMCNPLKTRINKPFERKQELSILSPDEQKKFEQYVVCTLDLTGLGMMISLYAGLRIGEVCALTWEDVDLKNGIIHIRHTVSRIKCESESNGKKSHLIIDSPKTESSIRDIPISSVLRPYLIKAKSISTSCYVVSNTCKFQSPRTFEHRYHQVLNKCGIANINYHALRHTFATRCIQAGMDVKSLSEMLGHANVAITLNTYVHSSMEMKKRQLEKLSALAL